MKPAPLLVAVAFTAACADGGARDAASVAIDADTLAGRIRTLSSDEFEGRAPSSPGETRTIEYLRDEFQAIGLQPGNRGEWYQAVPLVDITVTNAPTLAIAGPGRMQELAWRTDYVAWTKRVRPREQLHDSELVFVGYGIVAPEYDWDDYAGVDVQGRTVVVLVNDPGFATQDPALFNGRAMTYYGRWTYKLEEAARQGAAGALIVHETAPAGYGWDVVENSWTGPQFALVAADDNLSRVAVEGWITVDTARALFSGAGLDYEAQKNAAAMRGFTPVVLPLRASVTLENAVRRSESRNVVAVLPGTDRAGEYVIYTAHWDHLGRDPSLTGDQVYNGAADNATGTAGLLELAEAFAALDPRPARSVMFLAVTAEEQGLLGSAHYVANPIVPTADTVAAINMDVMNVFGPTRDITVVGYGNSELDDYLADAAAEQQRVVRADPEPEKGFYYRSDHFNFAKAGIPALYADPGIDHREHGEAWMLARREEYTAERYHKPGDEYSPEWNLTGLVDDLRLLFAVGYRLATESAFPNWREGTEFRAIRDADRE